jgi:hypothetical protein
MSLDPDTSRIVNFTTPRASARGLRERRGRPLQYFWDVFISSGERAEVRERFQNNPAHPAATWENTFVNRRGEVR